MKHSIVSTCGAICTLAAAFAPAPAAATEEDFNVWSGQFIFTDLDEEGDWFVRGEAQE